MRKVETAHVNWALERIGIKSAGKLFHAPITRRILNRRRRLQLEKFLQARPATAISERVARQLRDRGIASANLADFSGMPDLEDLKKEFLVLLERFDSNPSQVGEKRYIKRLVQDDLETLRFPAMRQYLLNSEVALAAGLYLGITPKLTSFKVWRSHFTGLESRSGSQNWHRDFNEKQMVRVFLYFNDVRSANGAGDYVTGTHFLGDSFDSLQYSEDLGTYATDEQVNELFPSDRQVSAEGPQGTIFFIDTAGLHRGGYHRLESVRDVALTTFSTNADLMATNFKFDENALQDMPNSWARRVFATK